MTVTRIALAGSFLLLAAGPAAAQERAGTAPSEADVPQGGSAPATRDVRPRRPGLFDIIKAVAPPLIDAARKRPPPSPEPLPAPVVPAEPAEPAALVATEPVAAVAPPLAPKPQPVRPDPPPVTPPPPPPVTEAAPLPLTPALAVAPAPPPPAPTPTIVAVSPPPPVVRAGRPDALETAATAPTRGAVVPVLLGLLALAAAAASLTKLRRMRQIAATRAALKMSPSLDLLDGACSTSGLDLAGPRFAIRAHLLAADHG